MLDIRQPHTSGRDWPLAAAAVVFVLVAVTMGLYLTSSSLAKQPLITVSTFSAALLLLLVGTVFAAIAVSRLIRERNLGEGLPWKRLLFLATIGGGSLLVVAVGGYEFLEFTESAPFCGQLCHEPMNPEYTTYQVSAHSRVDCGDCHVGSGAGAFIKSKLAGVSQVLAMTSGDFKRPIHTPLTTLRPASEICERCHWPQKLFTGDKILVRTSFQEDEANTRLVKTNVVRIGSMRDGKSQGAHWHVTARVWYLPLDDSRQEIGWVGVEDPGSGLTEYVAPGSSGQITRGRIRNEKRLMDCVDCHNRATHVFRPPQDLVDSALLEGRIDATLPFAKREAIKVFDSSSRTLDSINARIENVRNFYRDSYPDIYRTKKAAVEKLVAELKEVARLTVFPDMNVDSTTHPDNISHKEPGVSQGCYRCHGRLVGLEDVGKTMDASCKSCHKPPAPDITHKASGQKFEDCLSCHGASKISAVQNSHPSADNSTCTDCHRLAPKTAPNVGHPTEGLSDCVSCHGPSSANQFTASHFGLKDLTCVVCHETGITKVSKIPHRVAGARECATCHGPSGFKPVPTSHYRFDSATCDRCHVAAPKRSPGIPHRTAGVADCLSCHPRSGPKALPVTHAAWTGGACTLCHDNEPVPAPPVTHKVDGVGDCARCHGPSGLVPFPLNHASRTSSSCMLCHNVSPVASPSIPHLITGRDNCTSCHGFSRVRPFPATHARWTDSTCVLCHDPRATYAPPVPHKVNGAGDCITCHRPSGPASFSLSHVSRTSISCMLCHEVFPVAARPIPHSVAGRSDCVACHGAAGVRPFPPTHAGRTSPSCTLCHEPGTVQAPPIPHKVVGVGDCVACHGPSGLVPFPTDHASRTSSSCAQCHSASPVAAKSIPHSITGISDCLVCHGSAGIRPFPVTHTGWTSPACTLCHESVPVTSPLIPHSLQGRSECLLCHGRTSIEPFPANHVGRTNATCLLCHRAN